MHMGVDKVCMCIAYQLCTLTTRDKRTSKCRRVLRGCQGPPPPAQAPQDPWPGGEMFGFRKPGGSYRPTGPNVFIVDCEALWATVLSTGKNE